MLYDIQQDVVIENEHRNKNWQKKNDKDDDDGGDLQPHGAIAIDGEEAKDGAVEHIARVSLIAFVTLIGIRYESDGSN